MFFSKHEEQLIRKLASKMREHAARHDAEAHAQVVAAEKKALMDIVSKYKVHEKDVEALMVGLRIKGCLPRSVGSLSASP